MIEADESVKILASEEVKAKGRRVIELPSGGRVVVGRLEPTDLAEALQRMPEVAALAAAVRSDAAAALRTPEAKSVLAFISSVIQKGTIEPELFENRKDGPTPLDFTLKDWTLMFNVIVEISGYSAKIELATLSSSQTVN